MALVTKPAKSPERNAIKIAAAGEIPAERQAARTQAPIGKLPSTVMSQKFKTLKVEKTPRTIMP